MKVVLHFGIRGSYHSSPIVVPSAKLAEQLAAGVANVLFGGAVRTKFLVSAKTPSIALTSSEHFVSVERLRETLT